MACPAGFLRIGEGYVRTRPIALVRHDPTHLPQPAHLSGSRTTAYLLPDTFSVPITPFLGHTSMHLMHAVQTAGSMRMHGMLR